MTVLANDILKVVVEIVLGDFTISQNVHYFRADTNTPHLDSVVLGVIEAWVEAAYDELDQDLCDDFAIGTSTVHVIKFDTGDMDWLTEYFVGQFVPTFAMSNSSEPLPNMSSAFITLNTSRPQSRGRKFLAPFGENRQAATVLINDAVTAVTAFADAVLDDISLGAGGDLLPGIVRAGVDSFLTFTGATITDILGTQRRRRPGVGS